MKTLATVGALQALNDMEQYHERGWWPSVNVKRHVWVGDIPWSDLEDEFGADHVSVVREWAERLDDSQEYDQLDAALEIARECWWETVKDDAAEWFGNRVSVYSAGRSGGHLIVMGLGEPNDWTVEVCPECPDGCYDWDHETITLPDVDQVSEWVKFSRDVESMVEDFPYQVGWHLIVNVHDPIHEAIAQAI